MEWIKCSERMPEEETPVLIVRNGEVHIGILQWEYPSYEDPWSKFLYWDDFHNDGQCWENNEVTYWQELPDLPTE